MEHNLLLTVELIGGGIAIAVSWAAYQLVVKGVCGCSCGVGQCECMCGCKDDCPCRRRAKTTSSDIDPYNMGN
jgi:hypothetical protein